MKRAQSLVLVLAVALPDSSFGCGNYFGTSVLEARQATLLELWDASFSHEAPRLTPAPVKLRWEEFRNSKGEALPAEEQGASLRERLLDAKQRAAWTRWMEGDDTAIDSFPPELQSYARGARAWAAEDWVGSELAFSATPSASADVPWPLMATYMRGRALLKLERWADAAEAFEAVTQRSATGESDPLFLGARALSDAANAHLELSAPVAAVRLLVDQAALGVPDAALSLKWTLEAAFKTDDAIVSLVLDRHTRDAVILYALAHFPRPGGASWQLERHGLPWSVVRDLSDEQLAALPPALTADLAIKLIDRALDDVPVDEIRGVDRLAALMYRQGRYDDAARFATRAKTPLAAWVRAKLAVRGGDINEARRWFGVAAAAIARNRDSSTAFTDAYFAERDLACRIRAETGILSLQRGDFVDGLELFLIAGAVYWHDAAYVAERVLTIEELLSIVGRLDELPVPELVLSGELIGTPFDELDWGMRRGHLVDDPKVSLRSLAARRLMRAGRYDEAIALFPTPRARKHAAIFRDSLARAERSDGTQKAREIFEAALVARTRGLELLAFESSPDWAVHGANFAEPGVLEKVLGFRFAKDAWSKWEHGDDDAWIGDTERDRVRRHYAPPEPRFSYRLIAAELADRAADQLPKDSQAFAAVLCHATLWLLSREPNLARVYYRRFLAEAGSGALPANFGRTCPAPRWSTTSDEVAIQRYS